MFKNISILIVIAALSGCAAMEQHQKDTAILIQKSLNDAPICKTKESCDAMMEMAQVWVNKNAGMKIQTVTSAIIETYNDPNGSNISFVVDKTPLGKGEYQLVLHSSGHGGVIEFTSPAEKEAVRRTNFNYYIKSYAN